MTAQMRDTFEQVTREAVGQSIVKVHYFDIADENGTSSWHPYFEQFDVIAFGIQLEMETGYTLSISWGTEFIQYGLALANWHLTNQFPSSAVLDVSDRSQWRALLHKPMIDVKLYWHVFIQNGERIEYPQDLEIAFEAGEKLFVSASTYVSQTDKLVPFSDEITVIFNDEIARRYQVGLYGYLQ